MSTGLVTPSTSPLALALTGASGAVYGLRLLECLIETGRPLYLMISEAGQMVLRLETDFDIPAHPKAAEVWFNERYKIRPGQLRVFGRKDWTAPLASGSHPLAALVVCPCTTGTLAAIATGGCDDLIGRAADVVLKERRRLILVVRETPFSEIHLEHMLRLTRMGAVILPANPGFYFRPQRVEDLVDFVVGRVLDHLAIPHDLTPRWGAKDRH